MKLLAASTVGLAAFAIPAPVIAADAMYQFSHQAIICLCSIPIEPFSALNRFTAGSSLQSWIETLKLRSKSNFGYYLGSGLEGGFGDIQAVRFLVILPSEYLRDSADEWDMFQVILTYQDPNNPKAAIWLTTKNYMHRSKGGFAPLAPSPDWEYSGENLDASNARLELIASVLKEVAEANSETLIIKQDREPRADK
jgi:hypothetical protein